MNYLDRSNLTAAYVSGMKADLQFHGNQFNVINTVFSVGYIVYVSREVLEQEHQTIFCTPVLISLLQRTNS